ncbi:MAG: hypothetical protein QFX33_01285 [Candidatus Nezhaarchaeota archaeon]|nr:hypothetical protein [Candidatus Nezhaarchaeota archaeon]
MRYVKVVFLKEVDSFIGSDGKVYGPYNPGDEAIIPEDEAEALSAEGAVAKVGGHIVGEGGQQLRICWGSPSLLLGIGLSLIAVGFIIIMISSMALAPQGVVWVFPLPPIRVSGAEALALLLLPIAVVFALLMFFILKA